MQPATQPFEVLAQQMLALNQPDNPFVVQVQGNQIIASWNFTDTRWYPLFQKTGMQEAYQLIVTLNLNDGTATYLDKKYSLQWSAGIPQVGAQVQASGFIGKTYGSSSYKEYDVKGLHLELDKEHSFSYNTNTIKKPVFAVLDQCGWKLKRSFFDKIFG